MNPTEEQQAVINSDLKAGDALKVVAFAGTGKTATLAEYARSHPMDQMLYAAFNKSVQVDAEKRFPANVLARTVHSLAYQSIGKTFQNLGNLPFFLITKALSVDVYRATLVSRTVENWHNSADPTIEDKHVPPDTLCRFEKGFESRIVDAAEHVWHLMQENDKFPMTHSGYLKLYQLGKPVLPYDTILLDEAQDSNPVTVDIVMRQRDNGARVILVGDPYQQIYEWRGAVDAMDMFEAPTLYLTRSFRFGPAVASVANKLLSTFFRNTRPVVGHDIDDHLVEEHGEAARTIICRTNSELFRAADFAAATDKTLAVVGLLKFETFMDKIKDVYYLYKGQRQNIKERQTAYFKSYADLVKFAQDRLDPDLSSRVNIVNDYKDRIPDILQRIRHQSTGEQDAHVLLVTGHSAKGLEWNNVSLAGDFAELFDDQRRPLSVGVDKASVEKGEINLLYVAVTRAKKALQLNSELRSLMKWTPQTSPNTESNDMLDMKQCEEEFLDEKV
jgi:F-box protein 18 (helicase)